jgi:mxaA protein
MLRLLGLLVLMYAVTGNAADADVQIESRFRANGYFVGDLVHEVLTVRGPAQAYLLPASLPQAGGGQWVELRDARIVSSAPEHGQYQVALTWQIFKAVRETRNIGIPSFSMAMQVGEHAVPVNVHERQVMVSQLLPVMLDPAQTELSADALPPKRPLRGWQQLGAFALSVFLLSSLWLLWRYDLPPFRWGRAGPFAQACRQLGRWRIGSMQARDAYAILHQAINRSAGKAVFRQDILSYLRAHPHHQRVAKELEAFFADSSTVFFARQSPTLTVGQVRRLALRLRAIERGRKP